LPAPAIEETIMRTSRLQALLLAAAMSIANEAALACTVDQPLGFLGTAAPDQSAVDDVAVITPATRYVNVTGGTTVRFIVDGRSFTWSFQTGGARILPFDLARIAPRGLMGHRVVIYVADDPLYLG
jgi:hypothetical protein